MCFGEVIALAKLSEVSEVSAVQEVLKVSVRVGLDVCRAGEVEGKRGEGD